MSFVLVFLAGCGGTDAPPVSIPPPPPVGSPTPRPSPDDVPTFPPVSGTSTYYTTTHASILAKVELERSADGTAEVTGINEVTFVGDPTSGNFHYIGPDNYSVEFYGWGGPFWVPADRIETANGFDGYRGLQWEQYFANLDLAQKGSAIELTYSSFGNVVELASAGPDTTQITFFAVGSGTSQYDMPRSGTGSYEGIADGLWIDGDVTRRLYGSSANLSADFGTGKLTSTLSLQGHDDPFGNFLASPVTVMGTFTATGSISNSFFEGTYAPAAGYRGTMRGRFFGPSADEAGWSFAFTGGSGQSVIGAAVAKRR